MFYFLWSQKGSHVPIPKPVRPLVKGARFLRTPGVFQSLTRTLFHLDAHSRIDPLASDPDITPIFLSLASFPLSSLHLIFSFLFALFPSPRVQLCGQGMSNYH